MSKNIVLGVTGSIAAHKAVDIASMLTKEGHNVHVVLTADAQHFITAIPFKTLSRNPVVTGLYDEEEGWKPTHITLADEADLLLIAPATAKALVATKVARKIATRMLRILSITRVFVQSDTNYQRSIPIPIAPGSSSQPRRFQNSRPRGLSSATMIITRFTPVRRRPSRHSSSRRWPSPRL